MVLRVLQQQRVEAPAQLLQALVDRPQPSGIDDHLRRPLDAEHRRNRRELLLQCVALGRRICQLELETHDRAAGLIEPADALVPLPRGIGRPVGDDVGVLLCEVGPPFLGGAQLIAIGGYLGVQKTLRAVHLGPAASGGLLGKDRQQRLDDVLCHYRIGIAIGQGQQVQRDRRDRYIARQALEQSLLLLGRGHADIEIR